MSCFLPAPNHAVSLFMDALLWAGSFVKDITAKEVVDIIQNDE
jgi:hypothetical protein